MMKSRTVAKLLSIVAVIALGGVALALHPPSGAHAAVQATYYVDPGGSDSNPGTISQPFQTIDHARSIVSSQTGNMSGDIQVILRGGTYQLSQALNFGPGDSGSNGYNVIYQAYSGETPIISGGQAISGWSLHDSGQNIWQASVGTGLQTRQLYVNGIRASRASSGSGIPGNVTRTSTGYTTNDTSMQAWNNASDTEFVYTGASSGGSNWTESRCGVASISGNGSSTTITMKEPCWTNGTVNKCCGQTISNPSSIENNYALLSQQGQWYLDHATGTLYYIPRAGEDMNTATVVAPMLETLVTGSGSLGNPVHNIQFFGITFAYATWLQPSGGDGFIELQASDIYVGNPATLIMAPGNIAFHTAQNIRFERNTFEHLGAQGLVFDSGSQNNTVIGNVFTDISGTGVRIGDVSTPNPSDSRQQDSGNQVLDNYLHDLPVEYRGGVAIFAGYVAHNTISHNEIANTPYSGISEGWGWGAAPSYANSNAIQNNLIYNIMQVLVDGGGIYLNGQTTQPGSTVSGNYIHNQAHDFGALYPDEGSSYWDINNNVVASAPRWLHIWTTSIHDISVHDNFSDTANITNNGTNITLTNNYTSGTPWPQAAQNIINGAGLESAYQDIKSSGGSTNLALNKTASASSEYSSGYTAVKANDGDTSTGWSPTGSDTAARWQVDLGSAATLTQIQLVTRQELDQPATRQNFAIWASNAADMSGHVVLGSQGSTILPYQSTFTLNVTDTTAYRYVAAVKTDGGYFFISELRVFGTTQAPATNLARNKTASASSEYSSGYTAVQANDGDTSTGWSPTGSDTGAWWEVDLGSAHTLQQIQLVTRQDIDQPATRQNFVIWASNTADMSLGHVILGSQGSTILPYQSTFTLNVTDTTAYRYVAAVKTDGGYFFISELRVIG